MLIAVLTKACRETAVLQVAFVTPNYKQVPTTDKSQIPILIKAPGYRSVHGTGKKWFHHTLQKLDRHRPVPILMWQPYTRGANSDEEYALLLAQSGCLKQPKTQAQRTRLQLTVQRQSQYQFADISQYPTSPAGKNSSKLTVELSKYFDINAADVSKSSGWEIRTPGELAMLFEQLYNHAKDDDKLVTWKTILDEEIKAVEDSLDGKDGRDGEDDDDALQEEASDRSDNEESQT